MGDENLNNSEDTSVLFVSGQRKKQAEEEAKRKAEEEKARKEAEEERIRRQEEEVASRKDQAENLKKTLEQEEEERNKNRKKNRIMPIAIGAAAAFVILLGILLWPRHKPVYEETADFNAEYKIADAGFDLAIKYPDTVFADVSEKTLGDKLTVTFKMAKGDKLTMNVHVAKTDYNSETKRFAWNELNDRMVSVSKAYLQGAEILTENISDINDQKTYSYAYDCTYTLDGKEGAYSAWCMQDGKGNILVEAVDCVAGKKDMESAERLRNQFLDIGTSNVLLIPGRMRVNTEQKTRLMIEKAKASIEVPADEFKEVEGYTDPEGPWQRWEDENGTILLAGTLTYISRDKATKDILKTLDSICESLIEERLQDKVDFTDRKLISQDKCDDVDYASEYTLKINGKDYMERDYAVLRFDEEYIYIVILDIFSDRMADTTYKDIFNNMRDNIYLEDGE